MMSDELKKIIKQNEVVISLLGRLAFNQDQIRDIVISRKQNPQNYINGYNACDGNKTTTEIATIVGVTRQTLGQFLIE